MNGDEKAKGEGEFIASLGGGTFRMGVEEVIQLRWRCINWV